MHYSHFPGIAELAKEQLGIYIYSYIFLPDGKMELERTISTKGQIVLPKDVRDQLGLKPGSEIVFEISGNTVIIRAKTNAKNFVDELVAITPKKFKKITIKEIKSILEEQYDLP